jgi:hypothetical protein
LYYYLFVYIYVIYLFCFVLQPAPIVSLGSSLGSLFHLHRQHHSIDSLQSRSVVSLIPRQFPLSLPTIPLSLTFSFHIFSVIIIITHNSNQHHHKPSCLCPLPLSITTATTAVHSFLSSDLHGLKPPLQFSTLCTSSA